MMSDTRRGFTLVELAIVLFIVALMLGGMLLPLSAQQDIRGRQETEKVLNDTRDSLLGFVVVMGRLPCPDTTADGLEDIVSALPTDPVVCVSQEGDFPFQTVGTSQADGWGFRLRYFVSADFSKTISLAKPDGVITVIARGDNPSTSGTTEFKAEDNLITTAPVVILSVGKNGAGGIPFGGGTRMPDPAASTDELLNKTGTKKVSRTATPTNPGCSDDTVETKPLCAFDDQLIWLSANTIFNRLIAAGKLP